MFDLTATGASDVIHWVDLGLKPGIDLGFMTLRYYSLAYLCGIALGYWHLTKMIKQPGSPMAQRHAEDLFFYCTLGIILGGRLGYATLYQPDLWTSPAIFRLWEGGMSFHGGLVGTVLAIAFVSWRNGLSFVRVCDYIAVNAGFGMLFGRIANFINGELWGRATDVPWAMIFPNDPTGLARHPSQLYQAAMEGALVIAVMMPLFWFTRARFRPGLMMGVFGALIASGRFIGEFFRQPDAGWEEFTLTTGLSWGQWLTIPIIIAGVYMAVRALRRPAV